jgi:polar amino acid transport system substrate-binding protein
MGSIRFAIAAAAVLAVIPAALVYAHGDVTPQPVDSAGLDSLGVFKAKDMKIGVQIATVSDYFLMSYQDGALIESVSHHVKAEAGAKEFADRKTTALMGVRTKIEALLHTLGVKPVMIEPDMTGIVRSNWLVGMAWKDNSRDLGYAIEAALEKIRATGELAKIFETYGVTYLAPPPPQ